MYSVEVNGVSKAYGAIKALCEVTFTVAEGELFGLIGADGSGKSTLMRILASLITPDSGEVKITGLDTVKDFRLVRCLIGYMPGRFSLYGDLTVEENLRFFSSVFGTTFESNRYLIEEIYSTIEPFRRRRAARLSGGMKQKLALCCALIHNPKVLLLDEPTTGIDPVSRVELWQMLGRLRERGITIVVSTPYMDEAGRCDRMAFMHSGKMLNTATPAQTIASFGETLFAVKGERMHQLLVDLRAAEGVNNCYSFGETHHFTTDKQVDLSTLMESLKIKGYENVEISRVTPSIEDCYLKLYMK
jgi:ABC-2 type transport system ATP-binding protein